MNPSISPRNLCGNNSNSISASLNKLVKTFAVLAVLFVFTTKAFAQLPGDYRSAATGAWNAVNTWERFNGNLWATPSVTPSSVDGVITIRAGHTVSATTAISADQVVVNSTGALTINPSGTLTIDNGSGNDLDVFGTLNLSGGIISGAGDVVINGGAAFNWTAGTMNGSGNTNLLSSSNTSLTTTTGKLFGGTRVMNNAGTITISGSSLQFNSTSAFNNTGTLNIGGNNIGFTESGATGVVITNTATINSTGPGTIYLSGTSSGITFVNNGNLNVTSGTANLRTGTTHTNGIFNMSVGATLQLGTIGTQTFNSCSFTGAGTLSMTSGTATFASTNAIGSSVIVSQSGGTVNWNNSPTLNTLTLAGGASVSMQGNGTLSISNAFNWTGGNIIGNQPGPFTVKILSSATATVSTTGSKSLNSNPTITNNAHSPSAAATLA